MFKASAVAGHGVLETFFGLLHLTWAKLDGEHQLAKMMGLDPKALLPMAARQMGLAVELSGASAGDWGQIAGAPSLYAIRVEIAEAIAERDSARAVGLVRDYHREVITRIQSLPRARELRESDPGLKATLSAWLGANISVSGRS